MSNQQLNCPKCGLVDMVQKVSAIFSGGITTGTYSGPSIGVAVPIGEGQTSVAGGYTNLKGGSQSLLSSRISLPSKPTAKSISYVSLLGCGVFLFGMLLFCSPLFRYWLMRGIEGGISFKMLRSDWDFIYWGLKIFYLVLIGMGIAILVSSYNKRKKKVDSQILQWEKSMARWNELYFCARDDGVFDPNERVFIPTAQMMDYISR